MSMINASSHALQPFTAVSIVAARYRACACQEHWSTTSRCAAGFQRCGQLGQHRRGRGSGGSGVRRQRRLISRHHVLVWPCSSWAFSRLHSAGLQAVSTGWSGGAAWCVLGRHAVWRHRGLGWPWLTLRGPQKALAVGSGGRVSSATFTRYFRF